MSVSVDKRKIAKNTIFLYFRMLLMMCISLYTSRIIINSLGVSDFGVYSVVGGIITMFSFLSGSMSGATSRYLTYELGAGNMDNLKRTFSASLNMYLITSLAIIIIGEGVGLWLLYNKLTIPPDRLYTAFWVLQFSLISSFFVFSQFPYTASILAHEEMSIYAYAGIYEAVSKMVIAYLILISPIDKLIFYAWLLMVNQIIIMAFYRIYCRRRYVECRFRRIKDWQLYKKLIGYSGYDMMPSTAFLVQTQGIDIVLNMFFGPVLNAARAIAFQVFGNLRLFVDNFMQAVRPQVIKQYSAGEVSQMYQMVYDSRKYSYIIMLALIIPFVFEIDIILKLWLGDGVPDRAGIFCQIIFASSLIQPLTTSAGLAMHAIGKLRYFSVINTILFLAPLPLTFICYQIGYPDYTAFILVFVFNIFIHINILIQLYRLEQYDIKTYFSDVLGKTFLVTIMSGIIAYAIHISMPQGVLRLLLLFLASEVSILTITWFVVMNSSEREKLVNYIKNKINK